MSQIELDNFVENFFNDVEQHIRDYRLTVNNLSPNFYLNFILGKMAWHIRKQIPNRLLKQPKHKQINLIENTLYIAQGAVRFRA